MKHKKTLEIGTSNFKRLVENNHYLVDKTLLISDFFNGSSLVSLMPRPRRFGKTLNLSMIRHFFDIRNKNIKNLFSEFEISKNKDFCEKYQNSYPVISISLKKIKAKNWKEMLESFKIAISKLYQGHKYLLNSDKLESYEKKYFENIILRNATETDYKFSIRNLSEYLKSHFGENVIILIDEYDTPIIWAYNNNKSDKKTESSFYASSVTFMQTFLGEAFKENDSLQKGLLTGIMRISRESIFSDWNNFDVFGITSKYFSDKFGFTENETKKILAYFDLYDKYNGVKKWYDGYIFGDTNNIYNPWSIVNYITKVKDGFLPYWVNTSSDALIREKITASGIENDFKKLLSGEVIKKQIVNDFVFSDFDIDKEVIWTLLTYSGYLTQIKKAKYDNYELKIPNNEVKIVFKNIVKFWFTAKMKIKRELLISTAEHLINNRISKFEKGFKKIIGNTISYFDKGGEPERIYHVYTLGLLAILSDDYIIKSNGESGDGRYDILLIPFDKTKFGIVIEFKQIKKRHNEEDKDFHERIDTSIENARNQINENQYYKELLANKIDEKNIIKLAIVFAGKEPYMK